MRRAQPLRRTPLRPARPARWVCPEDSEVEQYGATCDRCLGPALPVLTGRPVARPRRPRDPIPPHVRAALAERSRGWCERCCLEQATDAHHVRLRSRGGAHTVENLRHVCRACHAAIHARPSDAVRDGFMAHSWDAP